MTDKGRAQNSEGWSNARWEHLPIATAVMDAQTLVLVESNPLLENMAGYAPGKLVGVVVQSILPEIDRGRMELAFQLPSQNGIAMRISLSKSDGKQIPVWVTLSQPYEFAGRRLVLLDVRNAAHEQDMEERLAAKRWALRAYAAAARTLVRAESSETLLQTLLQQICESMTNDSPFVLASVAMVGAAPEYPVVIHAKAGPAIGYIEGIQITAAADSERGQGPAGEAFRTQRSQIVTDVATDPNYGPWRERALRHGIRCTLTVPFKIGPDQNGLLEVYSANRGAFGPVVYEVFEHLAKEIGVGLHALRQREQIERERQQREAAQRQLTEALVAAVGAIAGAVEAGDPFTAGHQRRVAIVACDLAAQMGWDEDQLRGLRMAAMVHDIGKLAVPQEILNKPGRLTPEEFARVKTHVEVGYQILKDIPFPWPVAEIARQHHEKLDGSGYPQGLSGDAILSGARVLAVADIVESMACERPYRKALGAEAALEEVEMLAAQGKLDAEVVRVCARMFREQGYELPRARKEEWLHAKSILRMTV